MLTELCIEALLAHEDSADEVWYQGTGSDELAAWAWLLIVLGRRYL